MGTVDLRSKACAYLRGGKVTIWAAVPPGKDRRADAIAADVVGHSSTYVVRLADGVWSCTCGKPAECAHVAAVQLATGHPSLARRVTRR